MKIIFLISVTLLFVISPVHGQLLSDATGLASHLDVKIGEQVFIVESVSNFNIPNFEFDENEKKLTLFISSGLENNLGEIIIPHDLLGGNLTFYLNDQKYSPKVSSNEKISFVTLNFTGYGDNVLEIFGTTYLYGLTEQIDTDTTNSPSLQQVNVFDDSLVWLFLVGFMIVIVIAFIVMRAKKRNKF